MQPNKNFSLLIRDKNILEIIIYFDNLNLLSFASITTLYLYRYIIDWSKIYLRLEEFKERYWL